MSVVDFPRRTASPEPPTARPSVPPPTPPPGPRQQKAEIDGNALLRLFCRHVTTITLHTIGAAVVGTGSVLLPAVEVRCSRCGEFWHAELDASEAVSGGLEG